MTVSKLLVVTLVLFGLAQTTQGQPADPLERFMAEYPEAYQRLRQLTDNVTSRGHRRDTQSGRTVPIRDAHFVIRVNGPLYQVELIRDNPPPSIAPVTIRVFTPDETFVVDRRDDRSAYLLREHAGDSTRLLKSQVGALVYVSPAVFGAYEMYDVHVKRLLDATTTRIDSAESQIDNETGAERIQLKFTFIDPSFYQDSGSVVLDPTRNWRITSYELLRIIKPKGHERRTSGQVTYRNGADASLRDLPTHVRYTIRTKVVGRDEPVIEDADTVIEDLELNSVDRAVFSLPYYGLPDVKPGNVDRQSILSGVRIKWLIIANLALIVLLVLVVWRQRRTGAQG